MREGFLESLKWVVTGAMFAALAVIAGLCTLLILRAGAFRPFSTPWRRRREKTPEQEEEDRRRREKIRFWFWSR